MDHDVVGGTAVVVGALDLATACLPNLDGAILGAGHHPLALAVEGDASDVASVAFEGKQRVRVRRLDIVEFDRVVACGGEEALVGRDAETVDLGVWVLDRTGTNARKGLPEPAFGGVSAKDTQLFSGRDQVSDRFVPDCVVVTRLDKVSDRFQSLCRHRRRGRWPSRLKNTHLCKESQTW